MAQRGAEDAQPGGKAQPGAGQLTDRAKTAAGWARPEEKSALASLARSLEEKHTGTGDGGRAASTDTAKEYANIPAKEGGSQDAAAPMVGRGKGTAETGDVAVVSGNVSDELAPVVGAATEGSDGATDGQIVEPGGDKGSVISGSGEVEGSIGSAAKPAADESAGLDRVTTAAADGEAAADESAGLDRVTTAAADGEAAADGSGADEGSVISGLGEVEGSIGSAAKPAADKSGGSDQVTEAAADSEAAADLESAVRTSAAVTGKPTVDAGSTGRPGAKTSEKVQLGESPGKPPAGGAQNREFETKPDSAELQGRLSAGSSEAGRGGPTSAATAEASPAGKVGESISNSRAGTAGGGETSGNTDASSSNWAQRSGLVASDGDMGGRGGSTQETQTTEFSVAAALKSATAQEPSVDNAGASRNHGASASSARSEGAATGSPTALDGSGHGSDALAQSGPALRGSQPAPQPAADDPRMAGSPAARLEQALNADFERGFVGRLRDDGQMRLTVHGEDLGEIEVRVSVRENGVHASIAAQHDEARQLLNSQRSDLVAALQRYNLRLESFTVDVGGRDGRSYLRHDAQPGGFAEDSQSISGEAGRGEAAPAARPQFRERSGTGLSVRV